MKERDRQDGSVRCTAFFVGSTNTTHVACAAQAKKCERERPEVVYGRVTELLGGLSGRLSSLNTAVANLSASHEQHEREHGEHKEGFSGISCRQ